MKKAIKITEEIKTKNRRYRLNFVENNEIGSIVDVNIPNTFYVTQPCSGGYKTRTDIHENDGWKTPIKPNTYNPTLHNLGILEEVGNDYVYTYTDKSEQELQNQAIRDSKANQQIIINQEVQNQIVNQAQELNDNDALEKQDIYPLWSDFDDEHLFEPPIKVQDFVNNELKLFRAIQTNNKRENTRPIDFPAGWTLIEFSGDIEVWSQPIGGDGKYPYIDPLTGNPYLVEHNGQIWQNDFQGGLNVWEPGIFGWIIYTN